MESNEYRGYFYRIEHDDALESPRDWDNLGTMICKHKRYNLGDKENKSIPWDSIDSWKELEDYIVKHYDVAIILPVYLMDHSNLSLSTTPFSCTWDSGQVGFIFIERDKLKKEYNAKKISPKLKDRVTEYLKGEVNTYSKYLEGDVYWYNITDDKGEDIDSCGGYYGYNETKKECERIIDSLPHNNAEKFILDKKIIELSLNS